MAAEGSAAGGTPKEGHVPCVKEVTADPAELERARAELQRLIPGAHIWYVRPAYGAVSWHLQVSAGNPQHLLGELRSAVQDADRAAL
jgi:hypothetical protein